MNSKCVHRLVKEKKRKGKKKRNDRMMLLDMSKSTGERMRTVHVCACRRVLVSWCVDTQEKERERIMAGVVQEGGTYPRLYHTP